VLYGEIAYTPFDRITVDGRDLGPRALWVNASLLALNAAVIGLFYKQLKLCAFDPELAASVGIRVELMHYVLMGLVAVTTVGAFESVGAILVVAMLIVPGATAYLLTDRLGHLLGISVALGVASAALGYRLAATLDASIAGAMATVAGLFFLTAFLFSPRHGVVARAWNHARMRRQVAREDVLLWAGRALESAGDGGFSPGDVPGTRTRTVLAGLRRAGLLALRQGRFHLTGQGEARARDLIRRHRLYESYLGELGYEPDHVHDPADRVEHYIQRDLAAAVEKAARFPRRDPHDRPIPPEPED
ncbi:MAG TPA: iron chelate uptake ABC transporter family permease subunit, partial [bacterium]|nr:iron chelate uptake ABC transporter family permease subunit [bacterium]